MSGEYEFLRKQVEQNSRLLRQIEESIGNEAVAERKRTAAAFSDEQRRQLDEAIARTLVAFLASDPLAAAIDLRIKIDKGGTAVRYLWWLATAVGSAAIGIVATYVKMKP